MNMLSKIYLISYQCLKMLLDWNVRSLNCRRSCRASLEVHWNLAVVLYCENISARIVCDVKIVPCCQSQILAQCEGIFSLRIIRSEMRRVIC